MITMNRLEIADSKRPSELRSEINNALSTAEGRNLLSVFVREARSNSYPFPQLEIHDSSMPANDSAGSPAGSGSDHVNLQDLIDILEDTAARSS